FTRLALGPHLERIGLVPRPGEPRDAMLLRSRLVPALADMGQHDGIRVRAREAADAFLEGDTLGFTSEELRVLVPLASWDGDLVHWQRLHTALLATDRPARRRNLVAALGSFDDPTLAVKTLELVLDGTLRAEEWGAVSGTRPRARDGVWDWVTRNHDALVARLGELRAANLPWIAARFCSEERRMEVEAFFRGLPPQPGRKRNLALALEDVERCSAARETLGEPMRAWLAGLPR
ncbi:MAG: hypothetical protein HKP30_03605, partial [Myxococcales bacterium]|nr:hypothetical protein [Myxococcales bacterium]